MAANLNIHILTEEFTEEHYIAFQSNTLGGGHFNPGYDKQFEKENNCDLFTMCCDTPHVWVGEVSWLKAALFESDEFIPGPIAEISKTIGDNCPIINDTLIRNVKNAMTLPNTTGYSLCNGKEIISFPNRARMDWTGRAN